MLSESFEDISSLIGECRYQDCKHDKEVCCAIKSAIEDGKLALKDSIATKAIERIENTKR